ncbi:6164_t:CDS:1, partial [Acaulospora morrowiae]
MDFILVHYENRNEASVYFMRSHDIIIAALQYMIVCLNWQDESGLFFGTFVGYASGRSLNSSGFVESSALRFVYPYTNGIYRVDDNNELILVGYI